MKVHEIMENASSGASSSGGIATVSQPMGMISRTGGSLLAGKYTGDPTTTTPNGRFKNTPGN